MDRRLSEYLTINKDSWDAAAERFFGRSALPVYGPFAPSENKLKLFGELQGKRALEVGCGSGHSILYMLKKGISEIWGLDLSSVQIETARRVTGNDDRVTLIETPMEIDPGLPRKYFDIVYSIYALGWTLDLSKTVANISRYLKPGGSFIFSWEHPIHSKIINENGAICFGSSYYEEKSKLHEAWKPKQAIFSYRMLSTYLNELIENGFMIEKVVEEVEKDESNGSADDHSWYSYGKAKFIPATFIVKCRKV